MIDIDGTLLYVYPVFMEDPGESQKRGGSPRTLGVRGVRFRRTRRRRSNTSSLHTHVIVKLFRR